MKTFLGVFLLFSLASSLYSAPSGREEKPVVSKVASPTLPQASDGLEETKAKGTETAGTTPLPVSDNRNVASTTTLNRAVEASAYDEIPIVLEPPPVHLSFKEVVGFSRPGQTERVLTGAVDYLPANEILSLALVDSRQALSPFFLKIPAPPFVRMEVPGGYESSDWSFTVEDQNEQTVYQTGGIVLPRDLVTWDGFKDGVMVLRAGVVYFPILKLTGSRGIPQQYFGDPIQLNVLQFDQAGQRHVEFYQQALFQENSTDLALSAAPLLRSLLNIMRVQGGAPYRVTLYTDEAGKSLSDRRQVVLKRFLEDALVTGSDAFVFSVAPTGSRGPVTEFVIHLNTQGEADR